MARAFLYAALPPDADADGIILRLVHQGLTVGPACEDPTPAVARSPHCTNVAILVDDLPDHRVEPDPEDEDMSEEDLPVDPDAVLEDLLTRIRAIEGLHWLMLVLLCEESTTFEECNILSPTTTWDRITGDKP